MSDVIGGGEPTISLSDGMATQLGFAATAEPKIENVTETVAESKAPEAQAAQPAVAESEKPAEVTEQKPVDQQPAKETKEAASVNYYTREEVEEILLKDGPLDSKRLTPEMQLIQKSFQRGFNPKWEQAKRMREEAERQLAEIDRLKREREEHEIYQKEAEELGEDTANLNKRIRELEYKANMAEQERAVARQQALSMQISNEFHNIAPTHNVPNDPMFEDMILSNKWGMDMLREKQGLPPTSMEEAVKTFTDAIGITGNYDNYIRTLKANPEFCEKFRQETIATYLKEKSKGPTTTSSSAASVMPPQVQKKNEEPATDLAAAVKKALGVAAGEELNIITT